MMRHQYGLCAPATFWAASADLKARVCNGAGPAGYGWLVPDYFMFLCMTAAADIHDWMYWEGHEQKDKDAADRVFLLNMVAIIEDQTTKLFLFGSMLRSTRLGLALIYFIFVSELGKKAYWAGKDKK